MQDPGATSEIPQSSSPLKRRRQERTVYTAEQQQELKKYFKTNRYPTYQDRQALADRLMLQEHQVQVWFKNQRAKFSKLQRLSRGRAYDTAFAQVHPPVNPMIPEVPDYSKPGPPTLAPSNIGPAFQGGPDFSNPGTPALAPSIVPPVFPGGPDFSNLGTPALAPSTMALAVVKGFLTSALL
ncbi:tetrapeptide repeat homeobox protein 2-like [Talpa occidentalis]|uniref:tetrapeptide repeat homeobox protein 2-like n=1 Tax=Talpa occidentalis TaxID=50954 RepID=UPI00188FFF23|nr:tetrapeptide repeat homeobox protein 2-like [Talpa occidentalis]